MAAVPHILLRPADRPLGPYVPTLVLDWLRDRPAERYRAIDCTLVLADMSGFTRMTEMLGARGKIGAEEMAELINVAFEPLLTTAYSFGAGLIKWGGDSSLLQFDGPGHAVRGCRAAYEMQRLIRRHGSLRTSRGPLRLRMSIGVHTDRFDHFLVGPVDHRELLVAGPAATILTRMERTAGPGQIVVSDETATALAQAGQDRLSLPAQSGWLLRRAPEADPWPATTEIADYTSVDVGTALCPTLREHILGGGLEREHRQTAVGFIKFSGVDRLRAEQGPAAVLEAIEHAVRAVQSAALRNEVALLAADISPDGGKITLSAGAPRRVGHDEDRMIATLREAIDAGGVLPLRAGANSGRAFASDYGPSFRRAYSLMGDCVNLAARLMEHAGEGELLATAELVTSAGGTFTIVARPPFAARGKRAPVHAFSIGSATTTRQTHLPESEPLVGRDAELAVLLDAVRAAGDGSGRVFEVVGEPGMGKSRLLAELEARAEAEVLWTDGDVYAGVRPYAPFERLVRVVAGVPADASSEILAARLQSLTRERAPHLSPWLPLIGIVAGLELPATAEVVETDATLRKQRLEELTSELLALILPGPTALIFNDVHLMDDASRDLIVRLAADARSRAWVVIVSRRTDNASALGDLPFVRIELGPLSDTAVAQLLARATESAPLPPNRLATLADRAAGNPLFLRELVAQLSEGGDPETLPRSVEGAITARIDQLAPADRRTLRSASVLGMDVELPVLDEVLGADPDGGDGDRFRSLSAFLEPAGPSRRRFSHQLVREVAYEGLPYRRRSELHRRTAAAIEQLAGPRNAELHAELLSLHCFQGGQYEAAWRYSRLAAERARARYANAEAAESYRRALAAAAHLPDMRAAELAEVDEALGEIYVELGELTAADVALRRALRRVRDLPTDTARLQLRLTRLREISGHHSAALRWAGRAEKTLQGLDGPEARVIRGQLAARRARISYRQGRHSDALTFANAAINLARQAGDRRTLAEALEYADLCSVELGLVAGDGAEQALAIYEELGDLGAEARVRNTLGLLAYHRGQWPVALEHYQAAESAYTRSGKRWDAAISVANSAEILVDQGRLGEAQAALERAMLVWRGVNAASEIAFGESQLGRIASRLGRGGEAIRRFDAAREHFREVGELTEVVVVDALTAECLWLSGDHSAALALADDALARAHGLGGVASATPLLHRLRGATLLALGRRREAERALRDGLEVARRRGAGHEIAFTLTALIDGAMAAGAAEEHAWRDELGELAGQLGFEPEAHWGGQVSRS